MRLALFPLLARKTHGDPADIAPFIAVLSSEEFQVEADTNLSGEVDFLDIAPFIDILAGQ